MRFIKEQAKFADADSSVIAATMGGPVQTQESYDYTASSANNDLQPLGVQPAGMSNSMSGGVPSEFDIAPF